LSAGETDITDNANQPTSRYEGTEAPLPNPIEFVEEPFVLFDVPKLPVGFVVLLQSPIWGRSEDKVDAFIGDSQFASVPEVKLVCCWELGKYLPDRGG
jgi:hypothetical protein